MTPERRGDDPGEEREEAPLGGGINRPDPPVPRVGEEQPPSQEVHTECFTVDVGGREFKVELRVHGREGVEEARSALFPNAALQEFFAIVCEDVRFMLVDSLRRLSQRQSDQDG